MDIMLRKPAVCRALGVSRSTLHVLIKEKKFPAGVPLTGPGGRIKGWLQSWVDRYNAARVKDGERAAR